MYGNEEWKSWKSFNVSATPESSLWQSLVMASNKKYHHELNIRAALRTAILKDLGGIVVSEEKESILIPTHQTNKALMKTWAEINAHHLRLYSSHSQERQQFYCAMNFTMIWNVGYYYGIGDEQLGRAELRRKNLTRELLFPIIEQIAHYLKKYLFIRFRSFKHQY